MNLLSRAHLFDPPNGRGDDRPIESSNGEISLHSAPLWPRLDELMQVDEATGVMTCSVPLPVSAGRMGFTPELRLAYDSSWRNSPFGWGWQLPISSIERRSATQLPRYQSPDDDEYALSGDELVPALRVGSGWVDDRFAVGDYLIQRYRRRFESSYDRIERWLHQPSGQMHWRVTNRDNVTSLYGSSDESRISDPSDSSRIARWLLAEQFDDRGNIIRYGYKHEDLEGVDLDQSWESSRRDNPDARGAFRYLKRVQYGNGAPHDRFNWHYEVVFDYGDHNAEMPLVAEDGVWSVRSDPYSSNRNGFEERVWRRCQRVLMFHRFDEFGPSPVLTGSVQLEYRDDPSRLSSIGYSGYVQHADGALETKSLPPLLLRYQREPMDTSVHEVDSTAVSEVFAVDPERTHATAKWIDLEGSGAPGLVSRLAGELQFIPNLGGGRFGEVETLPGGAHGNVFDDVVIDLAQAEASVVAHDADYVPFASMRATADVTQDDPFVGYIDLNGDMADDVIVADDHVIRWYPSQGEDGFGDPVVLRIDAKTEAKPRVLHQDRQQSLHVADMTGDGLLDLVRVRSGEVVYWPNRGRGRFGQPISMGNSPEFDAGQECSQMLLANICGTGATDLVCLSDGELKIWPNQQGNRFDVEQHIVAPGLISKSSQVDAVDIEGSGTAAIVWVDRTDGVRVRYVAPFAKEHPHLLTAISNNLGCEVHAVFSTSTALWAKDHHKNITWLSTPGRAVPVVSRLEFIDDVSNTHRVRSFLFRHGYWDEKERCFAGFAFASCSEGDGVAHTLTKTWRHPGVAISHLALAEEFSKDVAGARTHLQQLEQSMREHIRDATSSQRALRGKVLRQETIALDDPNILVPHVVREYAWVSRSVQPERSGTSGSHDVQLIEQLDINYGGDQRNPRKTHWLALSIDDFGTVTRGAQVHYGAARTAHPSQTETHIYVSDLRVANRVEQSTWYRFGVPLETSHWQLLGVQKHANALLTVKALAAAFTLAEAENSELEHVPMQVRRTLLAQKHFRYWSNDLGRVLESGNVESKALLAYEEELAFDYDMVVRQYEGVPSIDVMLEDSGYHLSEGKWWRIGKRFHYDPARFYAINRVVDGYGGTTRYSFDRPVLSVNETEDAYGNVERFQTHPRTRKTWLHTDKNGNVRGWRFDPLGFPLSYTVAGKPRERALDSIVTALSEASVHDNPTAVVTYDLHAWITNGMPIWRRIRHRERHADTSTRLLDQVEFFDGYGRLLAQSQCLGQDSWRIEHLVERDDRGEVIRFAEPFFTDSPWPEESIRKQALSNGTSIERNKSGSHVRIEHADGTLTSREATPWEVIDFDANDHVLDSRWYAARQAASRGRAGDFGDPELAARQHAARAAALAAAHTDTPVIHLLDAMGNESVRHDVLSAHKSIEHSVVYDWRGLLVERHDPSRNTLTAIERDFLGRPIHVNDQDNGNVVSVYTAAGDLRWRRRNDGRCVRYDYDSLGQLTHVFFIDVDGQESLVSRVIWGGGSVNTPDAAVRNLIGSPVIQLTSAGLHRIEARDPQGGILRESLRPVGQHVQAPDWHDVKDVVHMEQVEAILVGAAAEALLSEDVLSVDYAYDALGRPMRTTGFDGTTIIYRYDQSGEVNEIAAGRAGSIETPVLTSVQRDAHGRPIVIQSSTLVTHQEFDESGNITASSVSHAAQLVHELRSTYDAVGNVMSTSENGQILASFVYDSLYRLTKMEGLEPIETSDGNIEVRQFSRSFEPDFADNPSSLQAEQLLLDACGHYSEIPELNQTSLHWDADGKLQFARNDTLQVTFGYSLSRDISHEVYVMNSQREESEGQTFSIARIGDFEKRTVRQGDTVIAEQVAVVARLEGMPFAVIEPDATASTGSLFVRYQVLDPEGSVVMEVADNGEILTQEWFMPSGESLYRRAKIANLLETKSFGFRGVRSRANVNLLYRGHRWYAPNLGRYIEPNANFNQTTLRSRYL